MADCPFCKATVDDSLVRDGGRCPRCFIEIPGEETPTHPGVDPRAPDASAAPPPSRRLLGLGAVVLVVLFLAGGITAWKVHADRLADARAAAVPTFYLEPLGEFVPEEAVASADPDGRGASDGRSSSRSHSASDDEATPSDGPRTPLRFDFTDEEADATFGGLAAPAGPRDLRLGMPQDPDGPVRLRRAGAATYALTDPDEIRASVRTAIASYQAQVSTCYDQRLRTAPDLKGTWNLGLTILPDGSTSDIRFTSQGAGDAEIENCVTRRAATWKFQPMIQAQRFELPFTFGNGT